MVASMCSMLGCEDVWMCKENRSGAQAAHVKACIYRSGPSGPKRSMICGQLAAVSPHRTAQSRAKRSEAGTVSSGPDVYIGFGLDRLTILIEVGT